MVDHKRNTLLEHGIRGFAFITIVLVSIGPVQAEWKAKIRTTTDAARWTNEVAVQVVPKVAATMTIDVDTTSKLQTIDGFGGCFNELGWQALQTIGASAADSVIRSLFDPVTGCKFNICRMPIGASDYALGWYSLNDNAGDTLMTKISVARDSAYLLQYIKAAMKYMPGLKVWGSPWSPPVWMKDNGSFKGGHITWSKTILNAYSLYLEKAVKLFRQQGLNFYALSFQNESTKWPDYPGCQWDATQHRDFIKFYLGPRFADDNIDCEIWTPTMNEDAITFFDPMLSDPLSSSFITTICFQWAGKNVIDQINTKYPYPKFKRYQTETECGDATNTWDYAVDPTFYYMKFYFDRMASAYMQWNMVLDQSGFSYWKWAQNAMITIDTTKKTVTYNPQYYVAKHFSYYVQPNAKKVKTAGSFTDQVTFQNPDGSIIAVLSNSSPADMSLAINVGSNMISVVLPKKSFSTAVIYNSDGVISKNRPLVSHQARVTVAHRGNAYTITPPGGSTFDLQMIRIDGSIAASFSSQSGGSNSIQSSKLSNGMYVLKGTVNGARYASTHIIY